MRRLLAVLTVIVALGTPGAASAAKPKRAPVAPAPKVVVPVVPAADSTRGRFVSEEGLRRYLSARLLEQGGQLTEALGEYYRALAFDPRSADLLVRISQLCAQLGDPSRSLEFADRALAQDPNDWRALWLQGAAYFSTGRSAEALGPLERACDIDSTQAEVLRTTARVAETLRKPEVAERAWRRLSYVDPEDGEAWFQIAAVLGRRGEFAPAEQALERAMDLNPTRPGMLFLLGWVKENLGKTNEAIELYQHHLEVHRDDVGTRRRLVGLLMRADRVRDAYDEARRAQLAEPDDPEGLQVIADLAMRLKRTSDADAAIARLRALNPGDPENTARVVVVMARNGRGREAARIADEWVRQHPGHPAGLVLAVRAWSAAGLPDSAVARARATVAAMPDSVESRRLLARALQDAGRYADAEQEWLVVRKLLPNEPGVLLDLGGCRERGGNIDGAVAAGREALKMAPEWGPALNFLGYVLADHNRDLGEARKLIERALKRDPDNGAYLDSYGWVLYRLGHHAEAREPLERAIQLTNGDPVVREHLGDVYHALQLNELAREQYKLGAEVNGENARRVNDKLRALR
ncbi:MAG: tetratricopeptide repeat protein [Candidatus Eisenbacteria bacterium]|nr:tetratricopeptide repeat protein [Candidatus Eisenbacteria bacterium]